MRKKILLIGAWTRNIGDFFMLYHEKRALRELYNCEIDTLCTQGSHIDDNAADYINKNYDMVILGGGGLIFHRSEDNSQTGWQFNCTATLNNLRVIAIGHNQFAHQPKIGQRAKDHIKRTFDMSEGRFSVRDNFTAEWIKNEIRRHPKIVPDAAFLAEKDISKEKKIKPDTIRYCIATDRGDWRKINPRAVENNIKLAFGEKSKPLKHLNTDANQYDNYNCYPSELSAREIINDYFKAKHMIGSRGHNAIISYITRTPFTPIDDHSKIKRQFETMGITDLKYITDKSCADEIIEAVEHNDKFWHNHEYVNYYDKIIEEFK